MPDGTVHKREASPAERATTGNKRKPDLNRLAAAAARMRDKQQPDEADSKVGE
jgi:hypothetical protein